jgi:hypothetical protein
LAREFYEQTQQARQIDDAVAPSLEAPAVAHAVI